MEIILCGDLNINYAINSNNKSQLEHLLDTYNLKDTVYFPTRTTTSTFSTIDNIFIDKTANFTIKPHINGLSDHDAQLLTLDVVTSPNQIPNKISVRNFNKINIENFLNYLSHENWSEIFIINDTNSKFNNFLNIYLRGFSHCFPIHKKPVHTHKHIKWITKGIMISCNKKKELYLLNKHTQNQSFKAYYKTYCSILTKVIHKAKKLYYNQAIEKSNNKMKTTWRIIKQEKGENTTKKPSIKKIIHKNKTILNQETIANLFNDHFLTTADLTKMAKIKDLNPYVEKSMKYLNKCKRQPYANISWQYVTTREIEKIVRPLKNTNSSGYDGITNPVTQI